VEVRWTGDLSFFSSFLPKTIRSPTEVQRKSAGLASPASPTLFCFKMTSPDFDRTWTGQAAEFGQVQRIPLEVRRTVCWVRRNWLGPVKVCRNPSEKGGECKVHTHLGGEKTYIRCINIFSPISGVSPPLGGRE
jgi:hypothetical protein